MGLDWHGDKVKARVLKASQMGVNRTMALCVAEAKGTHPFTNRTGTAERSIRIARPATVSGDTVFGLWGSMQVAYFKFLEFGTKLTRTRTGIGQRMRLMKTGEFKRPQNAGAPPWNGGSWAPTLRPVAAKVYPMLPKLVRQAYQELRP